MGEKPGTRVFKKSSPNCKLTVYLGKRDFVDHLDKVDPVDGVVLVDPDYLKDRKVFVTLTCAFRYGREDLDVLGLSFRKDLFIATYQAFPPMPNPPRPPTRLQDRLLRKLGQHAHPFFFTIPQNLPCSVTLQPGPEDTGKACGVDFEIRAFCAKSVEEKSHKRNSVRLVIRKVQFAPEKPGPQPSAETTRHFLMSDRSLHLEASLDKELYYHGEPLNVNVHVTNNSTKTVKKIKVSVRQYADICLFSTAQYKCPVAQLEQDDQVSPSSTFCKVYTITPLLSDNREKRGLALDGKLKHEDTNLASSTIVKEGANKEVLGILVSYRVKVKLVVSRGGDVSVELPFVLMHPKPQEHITLPRPQSAAPETDVPVDTNPATGERGLPGSFPLVLKKLMENPPREARLDKEKGKEKLEEDEAAAASTMAVSASLMPPIWDKTIPYDGESFHLEYMDLDEFLLENGIPASPTHLVQNLLLPVAELEGKESASSSTASPPSSSTAVFQPSETVSSTESSLEKERETPSPIDPNCVEVDVNFNPDPADLVLSSVPGGELFNPRKHKFAEEDLKPQPMIKKAKKVFVPDEQKDEKYWTRRKKNNVAAKRSRDARRLKENQITIRAAFLEKENTALRTEVAELRKEVGKCKTIVSKYETKYGPL